MRTARTARARAGRAFVFSITLVTLVSALAGAVALSPAAPDALGRGPDPGEVTWTRYWDSALQDRFHLLATCGEDVVTAGRSASAMEQHIAVARYAASGARRWVKVITPASDLVDSATALATDGAGNTMVAGVRVVAPGDADLLVLKLDGRGRISWQRQIDAGSSGWDMATDVATDAAGNVYVTGRVTVAGALDGVVFKLRAGNGSTAWRRPFSGDHTLSAPYGITVDPRGAIYATGSGGVGALEEMVTVRLTSTGRVRWTAEQPAAAGESAVGLHVALAPGGNLYVAGEAGPDGDDTDIVLARYSTAGTLRWRNELDVSEGDTWREVPAGLAVDRYGNAFVAGTGEPGGTQPDHGFVARWRPGGGRWYWDPPVSSETDTALRGVAADGAGGCYVAGRIVANAGAVGDEIEVGYFARFRANGSHAWERANAFVGGRTSFNAVAVWPGHGVVLAGGTSAPDGSEGRALLQVRRR